jgi:hypothetical protein
MKVKLKTMLRGSKTNMSWGEIVEVDDALGNYLIRNNQATLISPSIESAMIEPRENAMLQKPRGRKNVVSGKV